MVFKTVSKITKLVAGIFAVGIIAFQPIVTASNYGSGRYGDCKYSQGCTSSSSSSSSGSTTSKPAASSILLNDFDAFFTDAGKQLDLGVKQVIYFYVTTPSGTQKHSLTVQSIGSNYVDFIFDTGTAVERLFVGETKQYDVTGDGQSDIEITLTGITSDGRAQMTFRSLGATQPTPAAKQTAAQAKSNNWLWLIISLAILIIGAIWFILLYKRRKRGDQPGPH